MTGPDTGTHPSPTEGTTGGQTGRVIEHQRLSVTELVSDTNEEAGRHRSFRRGGLPTWRLRIHSSRPRLDRT